MELIEDLGSIYPLPTSKKRARCGIFKCPDCGKQKQSTFSNIKPTSKCRKCSRGTHGMRKHRLYPMWTMEKQRCDNPNNSDYKWYGARGIKRSKEFDYFPTFVKYVESLPKAYQDGRSIDRIDNNGDYERGNLQWSTQTEQMLNTRVKSTNTTGCKGVSPNGRMFQASFMGKYLGIFNTIEEANSIVKHNRDIYYATIR